MRVFEGLAQPFRNVPEANWRIIIIVIVFAVAAAIWIKYKNEQVKIEG